MIIFIYQHLEIKNCDIVFSKRLHQGEYVNLYFSTNIDIIYATELRVIIILMYYIIIIFNNTFTISGLRISLLATRQKVI